jgi:hypothetical protein
MVKEDEASSTYADCLTASLVSFVILISELTVGSLKHNSGQEGNQW